MNAPTINQQLTPFSPAPAPWPVPTSDRAVEIYDMLRKDKARDVNQAVVMLVAGNRDEELVDVLENVIDLVRLGNGWLSNNEPGDLGDYVNRARGLAGFFEDLASKIDTFSEAAE